MAKSVNNAVLDGAFDILDQCDFQYVCDAEPTTHAEASVTFALADVVMVPNTDYTKADGDVDGRKVTVAAKAGVNVDTTGTATHLALTDGSVLIYVTTCTSQALTSGNTVDIPAWDIEIADPV